MLLAQHQLEIFRNIEKIFEMLEEFRKIDEISGTSGKFNVS
jgi:hypothetical protein